MNVLKTYQVATASGSVILQGTCEEMVRLEASDRGLEAIEVREVPHGS